MKTFHPADHLHSRTFISLLIAQFLAAFNDQAIHASAMFFAINTGTLTDRGAISLMPMLFYAPWAIFCTIAGYFADRYSKRVSLIVWKVVEVAITLLALGGFWLGRAGHPTLGAYVVLSTVFLMGMHSAFFVPAKYGAMPEILTPRMLSKGNGVLESLSFLAVILGTVAGGMMSTYFRGEEYMIGVILTALAAVGAVASFAIERIPAANATRPFPAYIYGPLWQNIRLIWASIPLRFAVVGIAFFTFLVAYMRQVVYMHGQSQLPPWTEAETSYIVGMVAFGIGIGSPLVGYLSGGKVEVGLVPIGALGMVAATSVAALALVNVPVLVLCIGLIGFFTGFYLVPLFSLLQHRAPKEKKGDVIATSNFLNIAGAIAASLIFFAIDQTAERTGFTPPHRPTGLEVVGTMDEKPEVERGHTVRIVVDGEEFRASEKSPHTILRLDKGVGEGVEVMVRGYGTRDVTYLSVQPADAPPKPIYNKERLPALLFLSAGAMTLFTLGLLWLIQPDLFAREWFWMRTRFSQRLEIAGLLRLPGSGPVIVATDASGAERGQTVINAADRVMWLMHATGAADEESLARQARKTLARGGVVEVSLDGAEDVQLLNELLSDATAPVLPVHYLERFHEGRKDVYVVAGSLLAPGAPIELVHEELRRLGEDLDHRLATGAPLEKDHAEGH
jgi:MFS family permease